MQTTTRGLIALALLGAVCLTLANATHYCRAPPSVDNGVHSGANHHYFQEGSVITYWCNNGYSLQGSSRRTCSYSRLTRRYQWDESAPTCISNRNHIENDDDDDDDDDSSSGHNTIYCSSLLSISNGYVTHYSRHIGSIARYSCRSGYTLDGNTYRKCLSSGQWSGSKPECRTHGCDQPERPDNGRVSYRYTHVGARAWYYCNTGYSRVGTKSRTCNSSRKWEPELPACERSGCEKLISPHYGVVIYSSTTIGSYAKYFCKDGFYIVGIRFRKCDKTGWTHKAPMCKPIICDKLPSLKHGRIRRSNGYRWNSVASYRCDWDYSFKKDHGDVRRVCEDDGSWSGSPPLCFPIDCGSLSAPDNGSVHTTSTRVGAIARYTCEDGFTLCGWKTRTCLKSSMWSGGAPTCQSQGHNYKHMQDD